MLCMLLGQFGWDGEIRPKFNLDKKLNFDVENQK